MMHCPLCASPSMAPWGYAAATRAGAAKATRSKGKAAKSSGRKTAERLVVELKSKLGGGEAAVTVGTDEPSRAKGSHRDAVGALIALGYKAADADEAVRRAALALGPEASTEALIKRALA